MIKKKSAWQTVDIGDLGKLDDEGRLANLGLGGPVNNRIVFRLARNGDRSTHTSSQKMSH